MIKKVQLFNNIKIAYLDNEVQSNISVVFIHGNSLSSQSFNKQLNNISLNKFRLLAIDLPGHGESDSVSNYSIPLFVNTLVDFCKSLKLKNFVLVAHSLGGHFTIQALPQLSHCIGIFIIGTSPIKLPLNIGEAYLPNELMPILFKKELTPPEIAIFTTNLASNSNTDLIQNSIKKTDAKFREHLALSIENGDMLNEVSILHDSPIPKVFVCGENDVLVNTTYIENLSIPMLWRQTLLLIKDALHTPQLDSPEKFNSILIDFIESLKEQ
ncbi:alpha/beta fold hydrolase [Mariniflexile sp. AS56]|uniref:alpha/beta fold hydrolase n=1 Tax=Mariniflexile sp. AS56 TaxID=3063957 RepID=UPI0026EDA68E|nr:alpha/beta hydrolase [Mariniflexile sp. AS56]MDO7171469.1 alpha/beta hydrolase [Mariniflexile sp. AS56]